MENEEKTKIVREQTRLLYGNSFIPITVSIIVGGLLCWSFRNVIEQTNLTIWFIVLSVISIARLFLVYLFINREIEDRDIIAWNRYFLVGTYAISLVWGGASLFLYPDQSPTHQIMFFIVVLGMAAGGISSLCPSLPVIGGFLSLLIIPLMVKLMTYGHPEQIFIVFLVMIFLVVTLFGAVKINGSIRENIQLHLQSVSREQTLKVSEERLRHIFNNVPLGIFHYDVKGVLLDCNEEFVKILNSSKHMLTGLNMPEMLKNQELLTAINESLSKGEGYYEGDYESVTGDSIVPVRAFFKAIRSTDETIAGGVGIVEDFTEKKKSEQLIQYHASYDSLTDLPNRRLLLEHLTNEMARARRRGHFGALLFIDLDNFKTINDSLGHSVGDEVLKIVAKRITECIRGEDTAARMGGDEFIIILTELDYTNGLASYKAKGVAEEIALCLSAPCQIEGRVMHITTSVGISIFPTPDTGVDDVLKQADSAMYRAKAAGHSKIRFFLPHLQDAVDEKLLINTELRTAIANNHFSLHYQPQVDMSGRLVGAEALLRWNHPERGEIPPGTFIQIAEETGLMQAIGEWVLEESCKQIKIWAHKQLLRDSQTISINISGKEIVLPNYVEMVMRVLEKTGANPKHLGIELTEGSLISTDEDIIQKIKTLREKGIKFSVDDFGTGYSSLSYLQRLPLNTLKIDRSFVNNIEKGKRNVVLVDTIISMAQNLGLDVIAEGVETEQELLYLNSKGCTVYQGFYFSKPVPVETFTKMLERRSSNLSVTVPS